MTGLSAVTGWTIIKQASNAVDGLTSAAGRIGKLVQQALFARKKPRQETFIAAVKRLNLTEDDLKNRENEFRFWAAISFLVCVVAFATLAFTPFVTNKFSHGLLSLGVLLMGAVNTLRWHFRSCQVRDRELYDFVGWLIRDIWVRRVGIAIACLALIVFSVSAQADNGLKAFSPPAGDASVTFLREIFGSVIDTVAVGTDAKPQIDSPLGRMLVPFNTAVLLLGMIFVLYTTIKGTIDSAHDGEVLGKKMSEIWVPIRTVCGSALLLPLGNGYSMIQVAILWLAVQSAGIGDAILGAGLDYIAETNMVSRPNLPDTRALASSILHSEVCMAAMNNEYAKSGWDNRSIVSEEKSWYVTNVGEVSLVDAALGPLGTGKALVDASYKVTETHWRAMSDGKPALLSPDVCGALTWTESDESSEGNGNTKILKAPIMSAQANAVRRMIAELRPVAQQIAAFHPPAPGAVETAAANYEARLRQAVQVAVQGTSDARRTQFVDAVRAGGWIYLPTYYNQLIQLNDAMQAALNALPATSPISINDKETELALQNYHDALIVTDEYLKARVDAPKQEMRRQFKQDGEFPTSWGDVKRLLSGFAQTGIYEFTQKIAGSNMSHVGQIKSVGDSIMGSAEAIALLAFTASGAANSNVAKLTVGNLFDIGAALGSINAILMSVVLSLLIFGAIAAYYIPLIPFIVGITAVIKWFTVVFEAVIAAPIFAAAHIHPDGDDAVGRAGPGYMLILGLILRPALTVFGFFGSIWLAQPVTGYINIAFMTAVQGAEHNSFSFLAAFIAYVVIYVLIMTGVIHSIFAMVNWLPDNVLRWIGGALNVHGIGDNESKEAEHSYRGAMGVMGRGGSGSPERVAHGVNGGGATQTGGENTLSQADKDRENARHMPHVD